MQPDLSNNVNLRDAKFELRSAWTGVASEIWKTFWIVGALSLSQCILKWNPVLAKQPADSLVCAPAASQGPKKILAILQESLWLVACFGCFLSMAQEDPQRATWGPAGRIEITPRQLICHQAQVGSYCNLHVLQQQICRPTVANGVVTGHVQSRVEGQMGNMLMATCFIAVWKTKQGAQQVNTGKQCMKCMYIYI